MPQLDKLDYGLYLPLFFDGLSETQHPYNKFARQGVQDLLANGGDKIYAIIPQLIIPIKNALNTKNIDVMCTVLKIIQQLVNASDLIGPALIPFYRQLLPVFNAYKMRNSESLNLRAIFVHLCATCDMLPTHPLWPDLTLNLLLIVSVNIADAIDYSQRTNLNLGDLIDETLQCLEKHGGEDAFINIKYLVPTYESTFIN